jgi:hypothetical protein
MGYTSIVKTTMEISDELFRAVKSRAAEQGVPMRQFVEAALRGHLEQSRRRRPFRLKDASFDGGGLREGVTWDRLLDFAYEDDPEL